LAVGDAASSYDPISSQGIYKALSGGLAAATAIAGWLSGDPRALHEYRDDIAHQFITYLHHRDHFYQVERRWHDAPFWRHRRTPPHPGHVAGAPPPEYRESRTA
jgi:flavin-dependent dehydrogenase